jgi:hypothetical protein
MNIFTYNFKVLLDFNDFHLVDLPDFTRIGICILYIAL